MNKPTLENPGWLRPEPRQCRGTCWQKAQCAAPVGSCSAKAPYDGQ